MKLLSRLLLAFAFSLSRAPIASACPLCKDSIPEAEDGASLDHDPERLAEGYNYSIYFMLLVPFTLCGVVGVMIYRTTRNEVPPAQEG